MEDSNIPYSESNKFLTMTQYIVSHTKSQPKICMFCPSKSFSSVDAIIQFKDFVWKPCDYCSLVSDKLFNKINEQQSYKYYCDDCAANGLEYDELFVHMKDHFRKQPCVCPGENQDREHIELGNNECNILTVNGCIFEKDDMLTTFKQEVETYSEENPSEKQFCNSHQTDEDDLNHSDVKVKLMEKLFKCNKCTFKTESQSNFKKHKKILREKPLQCDQCEFIHCDKSKLIYHIKFVHPSEKTFQCELCDYKCFRGTSLRNHMLVHTGEKPFVCKFCEFKSNCRSNLNRHIVRKHTEEKPHHCNLCKYKSSDISYLKLHMKLHTSNPLVCNQCEFSSFYKCVLKKHIRIKHTNKNDI